MTGNLPELIRDEDQFANLRSECGAVFDIQKRLLEFVFQHPFRKYFVIEHTHVFRPEFGRFLSNLSEIFGDKAIDYLTLVPDAVDYYHRHFSCFGLASFDPAKLTERYKPVMSREGAVDSFLVRGGDVGVFWGSSQNWGIFDDRISWEIGLIAVSEAIDVAGISGYRCMDSASFSGHIKSQYAHDLQTAGSFIQEFLANYSI
ncbi:MAG TPA: hypothetical protein VEG64_14545 [Candidatus Sulfotelmatobacter sp.]|nr:hypothetical protein [Candidatus Sulfotelmatobacter sp.]